MSTVTDVTPVSKSDVPGVEQEIIRLFTDLQSACRSLVDATPGVKRRPADLARTLGVPAKLAWQVHRVAYAEDPLKEVANVPRRGALERFLVAATRRGAPEERVSAVRRAGRGLDCFVKLHAGSRSEFETTISALADGGSEQVDLVQKRAAFKALSHILGVQAKTHLGCFIYQPSATVVDRLDGILIRGLIGLRRFRRDAAWIVSQTRAAYIEGATRRPVAGEPLDPTLEPAEGLSLLSEFCSQPLPRIRRVPTDLDCMTNIEIVSDGIGNASAVTCLVGDIFRGVSAWYRDEHNRTHISNMRVRTPCEVLIQDVLIDRELLGLGDPKLSVFSDHRDVDVKLEGHMAARACDRLALSESVIYLGKGLDVIPAPEVPRYAEMVTYAMKRVGWSARKFDVYRCRIEYPVMPSSVVVHFDLPEKPA